MEFILTILYTSAEYNQIDMKAQEDKIASRVTAEPAFDLTVTVVFVSNSIPYLVDQFGMLARAAAQRTDVDLDPARINEAVVEKAGDLAIPQVASTLYVLVAPTGSTARLRFRAEKDVYLWK